MSKSQEMQPEYSAGEPPAEPVAYMHVRDGRLVRAENGYVPVPIDHFVPLYRRPSPPPGALPKFKEGDDVVWNNLLAEQRAGTVVGVNVIPRYSVRPAGSTYLVDLNEPDLKPAPTKGDGHAG